MGSVQVQIFPGCRFNDGRVRVWRTLVGLVGWKYRHVGFGIGLMRSWPLCDRAGTDGPVRRAGSALW